MKTHPEARKHLRRMGMLACVECGTLMTGWMVRTRSGDLCPRCERCEREHRERRQKELFL